jgi:hypothetical protein
MLSFLGNWDIMDLNAVDTLGYTLKAGLAVEGWYSGLIGGERGEGGT